MARCDDTESTRKVRFYFSCNFILFPFIISYFLLYILNKITQQKHIKSLYLHSCSISLKKINYMTAQTSYLYDEKYRNRISKKNKRNIFKYNYLFHVIAFFFICLISKDLINNKKHLIMLIIQNCRFIITYFPHNIRAVIRKLKA